MVIKSVNLETVCGITSTLPENTLPEIAFAGKSNVGKSSMINALMNRKSYAKTSSQPGKTQTINFYNINDAIFFVDVPGYGYAKQVIGSRLEYGEMIEEYLEKAYDLKSERDKKELSKIRECELRQIAKNIEGENLQGSSPFGL